MKVADGKKKHYLIEVEENDPLGFLGKEQRQNNEARIIKDEAHEPLDYSVSRRFRHNYSQRDLSVVFAKNQLFQRILCDTASSKGCLGWVSTSFKLRNTSTKFRRIC